MEKNSDCVQRSQTEEAQKQNQYLHILGTLNKALYYRKKMERRCIYRCPYGLTTIKDLRNAHIPHLVSMGPYHFGREHLQAMQFHKHRALRLMLCRGPTPHSSIEDRLDSFMKSLKEVEEELRDCYDQLGPEWPSSKDFLEMMLLDGCFILELLRSAERPCDSDPVFGKKGAPYIRAVLRRDMLMLENQIPLLALKCLLTNSGNIGEIVTAPDAYLNGLIIDFFNLKLSPKPVLSTHRGLHLLDVYRECLIKDPKDDIQKTTDVVRKLRDAAKRARLEQKTTDSPASNKPVEVHVEPPETVGSECLPLWNRRNDGHFPAECAGLPSATRLHEAGVTFERSDGGRFFDIYFDRRSGVLKLPSLEIDSDTAAKFMNLISFERMHPKAGGHVTSYFVFMDALLDRAEDVRLLSDKGIVKNELGSEEAAAKLFNTLGDGVADRDGVDYQMSKEDREYIVKLRISGVREQLKHYASSRWNTVITDLKHKHFQNPWACISLFFAILLILLTIAQTVYAVLDYHLPTS